MGANYIVCTVLGRLGWRLCPGPAHYIAVKCLEGVANVTYGTCRLSRSPSVAHLKGLQEFYTISSSPPSQNRSKKVFTLSVMFSFQSAGPEPLLGRHKHCKWSISPQQPHCRCQRSCDKHRHAGQIVLILSVPADPPRPDPSVGHLFSIQPHHHLHTDAYFNALTACPKHHRFQTHQSICQVW